MEHCSGVDTLLTRDGTEKCELWQAVGKPGEQGEEGDCEDQHGLGQSRSIKCGQCCFAARQETETVKRVIRYLQFYPRIPNHISKKSEEKEGDVEVMTDGDWAGDTQTRRSCSGGLIRVGGNLIHHRSKTQQRVALSSGEAEMSASVMAMSEMIGVTELFKEIGIRKEWLSVRTRVHPKE